MHFERYPVGKVRNYNIEDKLSTENELNWYRTPIEHRVQLRQYLEKKEKFQSYFMRYLYIRKEEYPLHSQFYIEKMLKEYRRRLAIYERLNIMFAFSVFAVYRIKFLHNWQGTLLSLFLALLGHNVGQECITYVKRRKILPSCMKMLLLGGPQTLLSQQAFYYIDGIDLEIGTDLLTDVRFMPKAFRDLAHQQYGEDL